MKKLFIIVGLMALFTVPAHAAYLDVPEDHPCKEAIDSATELGIVNGVGGGKFSPDREVTLNEYATMFFRIFRPEALENVAFSESGYELLRHSYIDYTDYVDGRVLQSMVYKTLANIKPCSPYPKWFFDGSNPVPATAQDPIYLWQQAGLFDVVENTSPVTRAEALSALLYAYNNTPVQEVDESLMPVDIYLEDPAFWKARNITLYQLTKIPQKYIDEFNKQGWSYYIVEDVEDYRPSLDLDVAGLCVYGEKRRYLTAHCIFEFADTPTHEFCHFIHHSDDAGFLLKQTIYQLENEKAATVIGDYCTTNSSEFFAEFASTMLLKEGSREYAALQEKCPLTFHAIQQAWLDADGLLDKVLCNQLYGEYLDVLNNL